LDATALVGDAKLGATFFLVLVGEALTV
jgi:hypothetical protein